ncbi:MAG: hypothetical protein HC853_18925 [Anaerolineae bacterium]|nr:hypothetical protein [Anaerolineae bacterium]
MSARRWVLLLVGLACFGFGIALMKRAELGLSPWEVLADGISRRTGLAIGTVSILIGPPILLLWLPLGEKPGVGTLLNILLIGLVTNASLSLLPLLQAWPLRSAFMVLGILVIGIGSGLYLSTRLGPGPRDGLMTALSRKTGWSLRWTRTGIEVAVLALGVLLGGTVGLGTLAFALGIGQVVQPALKVAKRYAGE